MNTPAQDLASAIDMAERALSGFYQVGADSNVLELLEASIADMKEEFAHLPREVFEHETTNCKDCTHGYREPLQHPDTGAVLRIEYGCMIDDHYQCPVVQWCGFVDPNAQGSELVQSLKRRTA